MWRQRWLLYDHCLNSSRGIKVSFVLFSGRCSRIWEAHVNRCLSFSRWDDPWPAREHDKSHTKTRRDGFISGSVIWRRALPALYQSHLTGTSGQFNISTSLDALFNIAAVLWIKIASHCRVISLALPRFKRDKRIKLWE